MSPPPQPRLRAPEAAILSRVPLPDISPLDLLVRRERIDEYRIAEAGRPELAPGDVELAVDLFGLTANNITYAVVGERLGYWKFFPHPEAEWGRVPVWGFGVVARSAAGDVAEGERFYGYFPLSTHLVVRPARVDAGGFVDATPHRAELPAIYNRYRRAGSEPAYTADTEPEQVILRPLFGTSFLLADFLIEQGFHGADTVVVSSASSKTAWGTALLIAQRRLHQRQLVGLTSPHSVDTVARMGLYDRVVSYGDIASLPASRPAIYVDFSGSSAIRAAVHHHFRDTLRASVSVGFTHRDELGGESDIPRPRPQLFFAPDRLEQRRRDWTPAGLMERLAEAWSAVLEPVRDPERGWLRIQRGRGPEAIARTYEALAAGRVRPDVAHVLSFT